MSQGVDAEPRTRPAKREDAIGGLVVLGLAALILFGGLGIPDSSYSNAVLSPRDFPFLIGVLTAIAGAVLLLRNVSALLPGRNRSPKAQQTPEIPKAAEIPRAPEPPTASDAEPDTTDVVLPMGREPQNPRILVLMFALLLGYILVFVWLGYVLSTFLFLTSAAMLLTPKRPVRNVVFAAVLSVAVYLLFTEVLNVLLPPGPLGGLI